MSTLGRSAGLVFIACALSCAAEQPARSDASGIERSSSSEPGPAFAGVQVAYGEHPVCAHVQSVVEHSWGPEWLYQDDWTFDPFASLSWETTTADAVLPGVTRGEVHVAGFDINKDGTKDQIYKTGGAAPRSGRVGTKLYFRSSNPTVTLGPPRDLGLGTTYFLDGCADDARCRRYAEHSRELAKRKGLERPQDLAYVAIIEGALTRNPFEYDEALYLAVRALRSQFSRDFAPPDEWIAVARIESGEEGVLGLENVCYLWSIAE